MIVEAVVNEHRQGGEIAGQCSFEGVTAEARNNTKEE